jgi:serine/threonine-protein kinase RsbW
LNADLINNIEKEIVIKSKTENLSVVREFIYDCCSQNAVSPKALDDIVLAVDEACTNVIKHAYKFLPDGEIKIKLKYSGKKLSVDITDYGKSFDSDMLKRPNMSEYFKMKKVGGLGVHLMKTLMDEVKYESVPGKYNKVVLVKTLAS